MLKISILTPETLKRILFIYKNISIKCEWKCDIPSLVLPYDVSGISREMIFMSWFSLFLAIWNKIKKSFFLLWYILKLIISLCVLFCTKRDKGMSTTCLFLDQIYYFDIRLTTMTTTIIKTQLIIALWLAHMFVYLKQIDMQQDLQRQIQFGRSLWLLMCKQCTCTVGSDPGQCTWFKCRLYVFDTRYNAAKAYLNYK